MWGIAKLCRVVAKLHYVGCGIAKLSVVYLIR